MKVSVFRKAHFNAAHRLHNANLSDEENKKLSIKYEKFIFLNGSPKLL